jgi:DNA polymerase-3 subunit delta
MLDSPAMTPGDPLAPIREGDPAPLYWIHGKERFLVDRAVALLKERVLAAATRDFNYDLFYGKEAGAQKILAAARTLPMMAKRRLIVVRDADGLDAKQLGELAPYVESPSPESCVVFVADKADLRMKFFGPFKKKGVLLKLDPLPDRQIPAFVRSEAAARGLKLEGGAAELIADEVGAELGQLVDAVERLALYAGERKAIGAADVEAVVQTTRQRSVFELCDAVGMGDRARALTALGSLLGAREPALRVLAMIGRTVRQLLQARDFLDHGGRRGGLAERLGVPPFVADKLEAQARKWGGGELAAMHGAIYRADLALKSSKVEDDRVMELLVLELAAKRAAPTGSRPPATAGRPPG